MGRHRLPEGMKRVHYTVKIKEHLRNEFREKLILENKTATEFFEQKIQEYLKE